MKFLSVQNRGGTNAPVLFIIAFITISQKEKGVKWGKFRSKVEIGRLIGYTIL